MDPADARATPTPTADCKDLFTTRTPGPNTSLSSYTSRLEDAGALASIGSVGDSYDNAQAESLIGLYKLECVRPDGPWRTVEDLELATLSWVHWFNNNRLHSALDHVPPVEYEEQHYRSITVEQQPLPA